MNTAKYLLIPTLATSLLVLAGCTQTTTNTNTTVNTNATNGNTNTEAVENTNEIVGNENTNTVNESGEVDLSTEASAEVDTSDPALSEVEGWLTYTNEEYGFSFRYPGNWSIKQEWLEQGLTGSKYNIYLQNKTADSILFFLTTKDFVREEGEGSIMFVTGSLNEDSKFAIDDLKSRGLPIYKVAYLNLTVKNIYYTLESYGGSKLNLLTIFQNETKQFPFLTVGSPLLTDWSDTASVSDIDNVIEKLESGDLQNQTVIDEYIAIIETIQF